MLVSPGTCHLAPWLLYSALRPRLLRVPALFPQALGPPCPFHLFPGTQRQVAGTECVPHQSPSTIAAIPPSSLGSAVGEVLLSGIALPCLLRWLRHVLWWVPGPRPGGWMRDWGAGGRGLASAGVARSRTDSRPPAAHRGRLRSHSGCEKKHSLFGPGGRGWTMQLSLKCGEGLLKDSIRISPPTSPPGLSSGAGACLQGKGAWVGGASAPLPRVVS